MKQTFKTILALSCTALLLSACLGGPSATNSVQKRGTQKSGFMGLSKTDDVVVTTPAAFKTDKVVIGSFVVGFATYKTDSTKAGGGLLGNGMGGKSTAKSTLNGVDDATMQRVTDKAYNDFVADLKSKGYTIADRTQFTAYPDIAKIATKSMPYEDSSGGLFGAKSKTKYFAPTAHHGSVRPFLGDIGAISGFSALGANPNAGATKFAEEKGVKVLNVVYVLDFANADGYGGTWTSSSSVAVGQGLTVVPGASKIAITGGQGGTFSTNNGSLVLGQAITSEKEFATVADETSGASRTTEVAANIIGVLGGVGTNAKRDYTFAARAADYQAAATDAALQANDTLVGKMASLK